MDQEIEDRGQSPLTVGLNINVHNDNASNRGSDGHSTHDSDSVSIDSLSSDEHSSPTLSFNHRLSSDKIETSAHREILEKLKRQEIEERVEIERELKAHKDALARHERRDRDQLKVKDRDMRSVFPSADPRDMLSDRDDLLHRQPELALYPGLAREHLEMLRVQQQAYLERAFNRSPPMNGISGHHESPSHHWTFEEQFKQLYELSDDPKRKEFLDDLFTYMQKRGTPVNRIPIMAKQTLDLYELFKLVVSKGGLVEVINKKLWREITKGLNLPSSITSAAFTLRTQYMKYIYPYECEKLKLSTPSELQAAIDGNRREVSLPGRRPSYGYDLSPGTPTLLPPTPSMMNSSSFNSALMNGHHLNHHNLFNNNNKHHHSGSDDSLPSTPNNIRSPTLHGISERDAMAMEAASRAVEEAKRKLEHRELDRHTPKERGHSPAQRDEEPPKKKLNSGYTEEDRLMAHAGMPSAHLKITSRREGHSDFDNSLVVSMEVNGIMYQGVLFAQLPRKF